jgi:hypothetical protein
MKTVSYVFFNEDYEYHLLPHVKIPLKGSKIEKTVKNRKKNKIKKSEKSL